MQMMSNVISDEYKDIVVNKALGEIHKGIKNIYGPFGTDVFIKKNNQTYYTRDGKEVVGTIRFNNPLANDILAIMYQAIEMQARTAGDGTTTLIILYVNLYKALKNRAGLDSYATSEIRRTYEQILKELIAHLKERTVDLDDELFKSMLYTCTQDPELAMTIYGNLRGDVEKDSYIIVSKSDIEDEMSVERSESPIIKCEKIFSYKQVNDTFTSDNMRLLYVDGVLDIANIITLQAILTSDGGHNIGILCSGLTESTRRTLQELKNAKKGDFGDIPEASLNNLIIFRMDNYQAYTKVMKQDMTSIFYNEDELTGVINSISFEAYLAHSLIADIPDVIEKYEEFGMDVPEILKFDAAQGIVDRVHYGLSVRRSVDYSIGDGLKINSPLNEVTTKRYTELKEAIASEKSAVKRVDMVKRLRTIFGVFVEVKVGSQLLKDSQRKFELILDAVVSSQEGFNKGVLRNNSIYELIVAINNMIVDQVGLKYELLECMRSATISTFTDMLMNRYALNMVDLDTINTYLSNTLRPHKIDMRCDIFKGDNVDPTCLEVPPLGAFISTGDDIKINMEVVEPFTIIETLLQNSTLAVDLAMSRIFIVDDFMNNHI